MKYKVKDLMIEGVKLIESETHRDGRGEFAEAFSMQHYERLGLPFIFPQDNMSFSLRGTFRGMHIQRNDPQGKLVRCVDGSIIDYFLDLRPESPTFKKLGQVLLRSQDDAVYVPPGVAHGFFAVSDCFVYYKCTTLYDKASDGGVCYNDPEIGLRFPDKLVQISPKDLALPSMMDYLKKTD